MLSVTVASATLPFGTRPFAAPTIGGAAGELLLMADLQLNTLCMQNATVLIKRPLIFRC